MSPQLRQGVIIAAGVLLLTGSACTLGMWADGWFKGPPRLLDEVDDEFAFPNHPALTAKLRRGHPPGSSAATLANALERDGFEVDRTGQSARYRWGKFPCNYVVAVNWDARSGRLRDVTGGRYASCV